MSSEENKRMRQASGYQADDRPLVCFLYILMRDHLPPGEVESIYGEMMGEAEEYYFTNGWLARHARDLAERLEDNNDG